MLHIHQARWIKLKPDSTSKTDEMKVQADALAHALRQEEKIDMAEKNCGRL